MDAYEREWRRVARSRSLSEIIAYNEYNHYWWRRDEEYAQRREKYNAERTIRSQLASSLEPVPNWVGACWISPEGHKYAVEFSNHTSRAIDLVRHLFNRTWEDIGVGVDYYLTSTLHWLRVGADGKVTDSFWDRVTPYTDEQDMVLREMPLIYERGEAPCPPQDSEFWLGLVKSMQYTDGLIDEFGRPIGEREEQELGFYPVPAEYAAELAGR